MKQIFSKSAFVALSLSTGFAASATGVYSTTGDLPDLASENANISFPFSGKWDINGLSGTEQYSGTVTIDQSSVSSLRITGFNLIEGSYSHNEVAEKIRDNDDGHEPYPIFGESEISKFVFEKLCDNTLNLYLLEGYSDRYIQRVVFHKLDKFVQLIPYTPKCLLLLVQHPYGHGDTFPAKKFMLVKN